MQRSRGEAQVRKNRAHSNQRLQIHYPCPFPSQIPPSHIWQAMHAWSAWEIDSRDCAHTLRVRVQPSFRRDSIHESVCMQQVFTSRQRTGSRLVQNDIRFVFSLLHGTRQLSQTLSKSSGKTCASKSCAVDMQNYPPAFISFILLGKLGTRQLSQTLSGRKCASTSLRQACEIYSSTSDSLLILGKLGTRQLSQTLSSSLGRECASSSLRKLFSFLLLGKLGTRQLSQTLSN